MTWLVNEKKNDDLQLTSTRPAITGIPWLTNIFASDMGELDRRVLFVRMPPHWTGRSVFHTVIFQDTLLWYCAPRPWRTSGSADVVIVIRVFPFRLFVFIFAALCVAYFRLRVATDMFGCDVNIICVRSARRTGSNTVRSLFAKHPTDNAQYQPTIFHYNTYIWSCICQNWVVREVVNAKPRIKILPKYQFLLCKRLFTAYVLFR